MPNIFIDESDLIKVTVCSGSDSKGNDRFWVKGQDAPVKDIANQEEYEIVFRQPNFQDSSEMLDAGMDIDGSGDMRIILNRLRYRRMELLLDSWNLTDGKGKKVPATPDNLRRLNPVFAFVIAAALERELGVYDAMEEAYEQVESVQDEPESVPEDPAPTDPESKD